ncbi:hypothetical protein BH09PSE2_BH09PSE2_26160 [soil metagenome]
MILPLLLALALQTPPDAAAPATPAAVEPTDIPHGAPTDDYGFVAWCRGALSGHMELYAAVKPELAKVEAEKAAVEDKKYTTDAQREAARVRRAKEAEADAKLDRQQLDAGKMYVKLYGEALQAAEGASAANLRKRGEEAQDSGFRIWAAARQAEPRTKMWSWIMWELPARCETAARRLKDRSLVLAGVLKPQADAPLTSVAAASTPSDAPVADPALAIAPRSTSLLGSAAAAPSDSAPVSTAPAESAPAPLLRGPVSPAPPEAAPAEAAASAASPASSTGDSWLDATTGPKAAPLTTPASEAAPPADPAKP